MVAQPSQSSKTYTRYRDDDDSKSGLESGGDRSAEAASQLSQSQRLLQEVLGETLIRNQENPGHLVQILQDFRRQHLDHEIDHALFVMIAREVLRHRLGERSLKLPADLYEEVGRALWSNDESRQRVHRFWNSLGAGA